MSLPLDLDDLITRLVSYSNFSSDEKMEVDTNSGAQFSDDELEVFMSNRKVPVYPAQTIAGRKIKTDLSGCREDGRTYLCPYEEDAGLPGQSRSDYLNMAIWEPVLAMSTLEVVAQMGNERDSNRHLTHPCHHHFMNRDPHTVGTTMRDQV